MPQHLTAMKALHIASLADAVNLRFRAKSEAEARAAEGAPVDVEGYHSSPEVQALRDNVRALTQPELDDLAALMWLAREDFGTYGEALDHASRTPVRAEYIYEKAGRLSRYIELGLQRAK